MRIFHKMSNARVLLTSFSGKVIDLAFAFCDEVLLGCIDETANVQIYKLEVDNTAKIQ